MSQVPERELIHRCRQGDAAAWDELFDRHYAPTGRFILQLGHDFTWEDVEDISQEVFVSVIKNLHTFQGNSQFQTWVFRIAANKARDYREHRQAAKRGGGQTTVSLQAKPGDEGPAVDPPSPAPEPDADLMSRERAALLGKALGRLDEPCREIIQLRYFGDLGHEEIAKSLSMKPKTVSSRLSKCLDRLEALARHLFKGKPGRNPV